MVDARKDGPSPSVRLGAGVYFPINPTCLSATLWGTCSSRSRAIPTTPRPLRPLHTHAYACDELTATTTTTAARPTGVPGKPPSLAHRMGDAAQACVRTIVSSHQQRPWFCGAAWIHTPLRPSHSGQPPPRAASHAQIASRAVVECNARCRADGGPWPSPFCILGEGCAARRVWALLP